MTQKEPLPLSDAFVVSTPPGLDKALALTKLNAHPAVLYAEEDAPIKRHVVPNDQHFPQQWGLPIINTPAAWDVTQGAPQVTVGVIDSGIETEHPDLRPNLYVNDGERANNGRDDDRNGYVDDVNGYDFFEHDGVPRDGDGHGSHVSGIIGARGNDGVGIAGVSWSPKLLALRALGAAGEGEISDAIKAYGYALRAGARVVNVSWGGDKFTRGERDMIADASNMLVIASSGNAGENNDTAAEYPCNHDLANVICVGASDKDDNLASFSNYGTRHVDLVAPGTEIASTIINGEYSYESGTSMAAPFVSGAAALMLARAPNASAADLRRALLETVDVKPGLQGRVATGGRLNVGNAVSAIGAIAGSAASAAPAAPRATPSADRVKPRVRIVSASPGRDLRRLVSSGLRAKIRCSEACSLSVEIVTSQGGYALVMGRRRAAMSKARTVPVRVKLSTIRRSSVRRSSSLRAKLRVRATDAAGNVRTVSKRFTWRR